MSFLLVLLAVNAHIFMSRGEVRIEELTTESQRCELGEAPHWDAARQSLYFVDIVGPAIFRYDYASGSIYKATIAGDETSPIGFFTPVQGKPDEFVIGAARRLLLIRWDGTSSSASIIKSLGDVEKDLPKNRFNDGKVDPTGRLYLGTMGDVDHKTNPLGTLYHFTNATGFSELKKSIGISNGLAWNTKTNKFYYIDSPTRKLLAFDYNAATGAISNESLVIDFDVTHDGIIFSPDGMTIDENGTLYVATWNGQRIIVIDPVQKKVLREIEMPTPQVTSLAFGGPNLDILFVTTAGKPKPQKAPAGGLFKITGLGVKGTAMYDFKL